jgi:hypothetical protein
VRVDRNGDILHVAETNTDISSSGTTGSISFVTGTEYKFIIQIAEAEDVACSWFAEVKIYQNQITKGEFAH